jgi:hypothetical protein
MRLHRFFGIASLLLACAVICATASAAQAASPTEITDAQMLGDQTASVREAMKPGGRYADLSPAARSRINRHFDEMAVIFQRRSTLSAMTKTERLQVFNAQQDVDRLLTGDASNHWFCEHTQSTGSMVPRTRCSPLGDS